VCGRTSVLLVIYVRSGVYRQAWDPQRGDWSRLERWLRPQDTPLPLSRRMTARCLDRAACNAYREAKLERQRVRSKVPEDVVPRGLHPDQRATCKWCGEAIYRRNVKGQIVPANARRWHDGREVDPRAAPEPNCLEEYRALKSWRFRDAVGARDKGVCASCGRDVLAEQQREAEARWRADNPEPTWEADHIVPLEDGGEHLMANAQTLCSPCHRRKTAEEATARAARRRQRREDWAMTMELEAG
jgi:5-methylcytosine-specific restriction endonuclease McrA